MRKKISDYITIALLLSSQPGFKNFPIVFLCLTQSSCLHLAGRLFCFWLISNFVTKVIPIPMPFWIGVGTPIIWSSGIILSDFTIEQQKISRFIRDYLKFYRVYGRKRKLKYLNDGILYYKPDYILKKEGKLSETNE